MKMKLSLALLLSAFLPIASANASITGVTETGLGGDTPSIIGHGFGEDVLAFSDRTHQHNGAAFDALFILSVPTGTTIVPLPGYLVGGDYVRFANDARDQAGYSAIVTANVPTTWYLLLDNRLNGPAGNLTSPNTTDPTLGGTLQWVIDGGWQRVNTGISPNGQADYTAVDEGGDQVGAGMGLNQFYSVWTLPGTPMLVTLSNNGVDSGNMIALVAGATLVAPAAVTLTRGTYVSGNASSLAASDNVDLSLRRLNSDLQSRTEFEVKSTSPTATPTTFEFTLEGSVFARGNVVQTIELFDYVAAAWELVDSSDARRAPAPDSVVTATPTGDLARFVEAGTMCIEARIRYKSDRNRQKFASNTDQAIWTIGQ